MLIGVRVFADRSEGIWLIGVRKNGDSSEGYMLIGVRGLLPIGVSGII